MNKSVQAIDIVKIPATGQKSTVNKVSGEDSGPSFSGILSDTRAVAPDKADGRLLQAPGKKLPDQAERQESAPMTIQHPAETGIPDTETGSALTGDTGLPLQIGVPLLPIKQVVQQSEQQGVQLSAQTAEPLATTEVLPDEMPLVPGVVQVTDQAAILPTNGQQISFSDQVTDKRGVARIVVNKTQGLSEQHDFSQSIRQESAKGPALVENTPVPAAGRAESAPQRVPDNLREAVRLAVTSQIAGNELRQGMQDNRSLLPDSKLSAVPGQSVSTAIPYLQVLTETASSLPSARVQVPVGQQGWDQAVGQQVAWFVSRDISAANLRLNPQHLGPIEMQVIIDGDKANVSFLSQHSVVRESLESSIPRLREMLAENGINLGSVNVSEHGSSSQQGSASEQELASAANAKSDAETGSGTTLQFRQPVAHGLVDYYV